MRRDIVFMLQPRFPQHCSFILFRYFGSIHQEGAYVDGFLGFPAGSTSLSSTTLHVLSADAFCEQICKGFQMHGSLAWIILALLIVHNILQNKGTILVSIQRGAQASSLDGQCAAGKASFVKASVAARVVSCLKRLIA